MKIIDRVRRRAGERAGTPAADDARSASPRVLRPDKAPPLLMTTAQGLEALGRAGMQGVAVVRFTRELWLWIPDIRPDRAGQWLHVAGLGGANFLFGHERAGRSAFFAASAPGDGFRAGRSTCPLQGLRRQQHAHSAARTGRARGRGRCPAPDITISRRRRHARRRPRPRIASLPQTSTARTSCSRQQGSARPLS